MEDIKIQIAKVDESVKSAHKRLDHLEELTEEIHKIATATELLAQTVARQQKDIDKINGNLETINMKPNKWVDQIKSTLTSAFFGAIGAAFVALILK